MSNKITDAELRQIRATALAAGKLSQVEMCDIALERPEGKPAVHTTVRPRSKEWNRMWAMLKTEFGDTVQEHNFERWQYMGTVDGQHEFRHRSHPVFGRRYVWRCAAAV